MSGGEVVVLPESNTGTALQSRRSLHFFAVEGDLRVRAAESESIKQPRELSSVVNSDSTCYFVQDRDANKTSNTDVLEAKRQPSRLSIDALLSEAEAGIMMPGTRTKLSILRSLSIFDDLPPLPSSDVINEVITRMYQDLKVGDNLIFLSVGCRLHPARAAIRPLFAKRASRLVGWAVARVREVGPGSLASLQGIIMWTTFLMTDLSKGKTGQSWYWGTVAIAQATGMNRELDVATGVDWVEKEERRRAWCELVLREPPQFMDTKFLGHADTSDEFWLLFVGVATQCRKVMRFSLQQMPQGGAEAETGFMLIKEVTQRLLNVFPPLVRSISSGTRVAGRIYYEWSDHGDDLVPSCPFPIAALAIMVYSTWVIPLGPRTSNFLDDVTCLPTIAGGTARKQTITLSDVLDSKSRSEWTSDKALKEVVTDALEKADVHGRALKVHAKLTKAGEALWSL
ncbi:hypothetical protein HDU93_008125 [Gonapodya sp. JEL0774]|nr:hypothetical protein HDU93_008125 [Gonapodya sp. JEL0774]